jgi:two-component system chemotaxis sensor kinase CheA
VETAGNEEVLQYRGEILPLIRLAKVLGEQPDEAREVLQVIVYSEGGRRVGLVVSEILDIVEETLTVKRRRAHAGVLGSAVVQGRVTELLDVHGVIRFADPTFFDQAAPQARESN